MISWYHKGAQIKIMPIVRAHKAAYRCMASMLCSEGKTREKHRLRQPVDLP